MTAGANDEEKLIHIQATHIQRTRKGTRKLASSLREKLRHMELQQILFEENEVRIKLNENNVMSKSDSGAEFVLTHECRVVRIFGGEPDIVSLVPVGCAGEAAEDDSSDVSLSITVPYNVFHDHTDTC
jgi:hypothetical protein